MNDKPHSELVELDVESIIIDERLPRDLGDLMELSSSLEEDGQLQTILVDENNHLIAGMRRLMASKIGMRPKIFAIRVTGMDLFKKKRAEMVENLMRKNLSWAEEDQQRAELHRIHQEVYGIALGGRPTVSGVRPKTWGLSDTADLLDTSDTSISLSLKMSDALKKNPLLAAESSRSVAHAKLKRAEIMELRKILSARAGVEITEGVRVSLALDLLKSLPSESVGLVVMDPPWGVMSDGKYLPKFGVLTDEASNFDDDFVKSLHTIREIRDELYRVMLPSSHLYVFCSSLQIPFILVHYSERFSVRQNPLMWCKGSQTGGFNVSADFQWTSSYEPILFMWKGARAFNLDDPLLVHRPCDGDTLTFPRPKSLGRYGINEKSLTLLRNLILLSSNPWDLVLDPFCGSGSTLVAARQVGRRFLGGDKNPEVVTVARARLVEDLAGELQEETVNG